MAVAAATWVRMMRRSKVLLMALALYRNDGITVFIVVIVTTLLLLCVFL